MKFIFVSAIVLVLLGLNLYAQDEKTEHRKNAIYMEIMGNGVVYSFNYERIFTENNVSPFIRIGGNALRFDSLDTFKFFCISELGVVLGKQKNAFDASLGYTFPMDKDVEDRFFIIRAGFRYSGPKGFLLRLSPMYIINSRKGDVFGNNLWIGLSLGYSF